MNSLIFSQIISGETYVHIKTCTQMFIVTHGCPNLVEFYSFAYRYPVFPELFTKETLLYSLSILGSIFKVLLDCALLRRKFSSNFKVFLAGLRIKLL